MKPKELAVKYAKWNLTEKQIYNKACRDDWTSKKKKKEELEEKKEEIIEEEIFQKLKEEIKEVKIAELDRTRRQLYLFDLLAKKLENTLQASFQVQKNKQTGEIEYIEYKATDVKAIASAVLDLQKGERIAEGLDKEDKKAADGGTLADLIGAIRESAADEVE